MNAGKDVSSCGFSEPSACHTLSWTLDVFYNYTQQHLKSWPILQIETDKDLSLEKKLMVRKNTFCEEEKVEDRTTLIYQL